MCDTVLRRALHIGSINHKGAASAEEFLLIPYSIQYICYK